ncbi:hypothetical protein [Paenibacillus xylaniclasticus]|uniref:hypothetical protein n=1 Tax=Paenibacillus xylaniclasticus TaxID=588083 RepID=UPI000FDC2C39|nr:MULTISPECIES: hypothetical protein [Paenibacillus]GFN32521.1 hypothetical protein PCURB6_27810 [Paenibacillus curdlanolyticus]
MRQNFNVKMFERWLKEGYGEVIADAPTNSMTPVIGTLPDGKKEYIFVVKGEEWLYEPLKGKTIEDTVPMGAKAYMEGINLIWGFDIEPDINLECEIPHSKIYDFLCTIKQQDKLTVVIVNHITTNIVWMTNNFPFEKVKEQFKPLFDYFDVK